MIKKKKAVVKKKTVKKKPLLIKKKKVVVKKAVRTVRKKKRVPAKMSLVPANKTIDTGAVKMTKKRKIKKVAGTAKKSYKRRSSGPKVSIKSALMDTAAAVGGAVVGSFVVNKLPIPAKFKAAIPVGLGILLQTKLAKNNKLLHHLGTGLLVVGGLSLIRQFVPQVPLLAGEDDLAMLGYPQGELGYPQGELGYVDDELYGDYVDEMQGEFSDIDE